MCEVDKRGISRSIELDESSKNACGSVLMISVAINL